ncbi:chromate transporter [Mycoplasma sp. U97]|uniref:chromate transporter n=1 Tax=Mycoplasma tauri TaxID=547987 RepID=UPI001CBB479C|nr:chromate transporter [Mycoplasma tauri]MBZ4212711.1 chromate transporter [Mycoplasma tauri]
MNVDLSKNYKKKPTFFNVLWFILFTSFVGFGGGNALLPIYKRYTVDKYGWLTEKEFEENVILTNMLPGASVIEALSYIAFKNFNFWKGSILVIIGVLPHVIFGFVLFYFTKYIPLEYLFVIEVAVLSTIIGSLVIFIFNYVKKGAKQINVGLWFVLFLVTFVFTFFIPAPYNMPISIMVFIILIFTVVFFTKQKIGRNQNKKTSNLISANDDYEVGA